jgi:hypothetical protein
VQPEHLKFGGGAAQTVFNPYVLMIVILMGILICVRARRQVIALFLIPSILIPLDQVLVLGNLHFPMLRVLVLFGIIRMIAAKVTSRTEIFSGGVNRLDTTVILFWLVTAVNALLLWRDSGMLVKQSGDIFTAFGIYFLMRSLIRDQEDADKAVRTLAYIALAVAAVMTYEQVTGHNPYALLGGAKASWYGSLMTREDRLRALAGFGHPILAGTFGAIVTPLFVALWLKDRKNLKIAVLGVAASTVIVIACASSTPMLAYAGAVAVFCMWSLRDLMRPIRWGIVLSLASLHMVMKAPVWQLIDRINVVGGSSGYHRYQLVNQCILHFKDWWLYGVKDTGVWGWDMWDTANQYVSVADSTGLLPLILFVAILTYGFKYLGIARKSSVGNKQMELYYWGLGAAMFANAVGFFGISYWDQTEVVWYTFLAIIAATSITVAVPAQTAATVPAPDAPAKLMTALRPAYRSETPKAPVPTSYGRMVTGRWLQKSTTK